MVGAWTRTHAELSVHAGLFRWIALTLKVFLSLIIGCGLMALVFYCSRRGYDVVRSEHLLDDAEDAFGQ